MKQRPHRAVPRVDADGVRTTRDERASWQRDLVVIASVATMALAAFFLLRPPTRHGSASDAGSSANPDAQPRTSLDRPDGAAPGAVRRDDDVPSSRHGALRGAEGRIRRRTRPSDEGGGEEARRNQATDPEVADEIDARDYIAALRAGGETGGLAAFTPPGTRPPRTGIVVPEDYELPEGFARHYQTTDDGVRLAPILTVAPGYELLDGMGQPVPLEDGHIVPPEFAPPDLPVQMLEVPTAGDRAQRDH